MVNELLILVVLVALLAFGYTVSKKWDEWMPDSSSGSGPQDGGSLASSGSDSSPDNTGSNTTGRFSRAEGPGISSNADNSSNFNALGTGRSDAGTGSTNDDVIGDSTTTSKTRSKPNIQPTKNSDMTGIKDTGPCGDVNETEPDQDDDMETNFYDPNEEEPDGDTANKCCPNCGAEAGADADFCPDCGVPFDPDVVILRIGDEVLKLPHDESVGKKIRNHLITTEFTEYAARHVSREHCKFIREGGTTYVVDLDSTHGTTVNNEEVPVKDRLSIEDGDEIGFADVVTATVIAA